MARIGKTKPLSVLLQSCPVAPRNEVNHNYENENIISHGAQSSSSLNMCEPLCNLPGCPKEPCGNTFVFLDNEYRPVPHNVNRNSNVENENIYDDQQTHVHDTRALDNAHHCPSDSSDEVENSFGRLRILEKIVLTFQTIPIEALMMIIKEVRMGQGYIRQLKAEVSLLK